MLGLFDSGLGGLTVLTHVRELLPQYDVLYLADQAHVPYGDRDDEDLLRLLRTNIGILSNAGADAVVMACNTTCAVASRRGWPSSPIPILDLIASAATAVAESGVKRIGVLATSATVRSEAYARAIRLVAPSVAVREVAAPELVPLVESGITEGAAARDAVARAYAPLAGTVDALVLGCTHYPFLRDAFAEVCGGVELIDPSRVQAEAAVRLVADRGLRPASGSVRYVTTGDAEVFARRLAQLRAEPGAIAGLGVSALAGSAADIAAAGTAPAGTAAAVAGTSSSA